MRIPFVRNLIYKNEYFSVPNLDANLREFNINRILNWLEQKFYWARQVYTFKLECTVEFNSRFHA